MLGGWCCIKSPPSTLQLFHGLQGHYRHRVDNGKFYCTYFNKNNFIFLLDIEEGIELTLQAQVNREDSRCKFINFYFYITSI